MRLIDADALTDKVNDLPRDYARLELSAVLDEIEFAPTVEAIEVVHCRDCKHSRNMPNGACYLHTEQCTNKAGYKGSVVCVEPNDFCSYGEKEGAD